MVDVAPIAAEQARLVAGRLYRQARRGRDRGEVTAEIELVAQQAGLTYRELVDAVLAAQRRWEASVPTDTYGPGDRVIDSNGTEYDVTELLGAVGESPWLRLRRVADQRDLTWFPGPRLRLIRRADAEVDATPEKDPVELWARSVVDPVIAKAEQRRTAAGSRHRPR
ncbi:MULTISPECIES: hypothetical protein [unclassified Nocardioides]|uniref:hypothetical protein n=1 Tax=unclassified Nocardioides TaxID=2615069 RepID=UPI00070268B5|nr:MULTISPECIES: hypothetical protein [unclassified Nocardioides]KRC53945.1 hypothetical protein ASE19_07645 [Nocardioides sp. Root79]KRC71281.1 hypothetical protein ASE20_10060 [Nocardioides sp. Root240]